MAGGVVSAQPVDVTGHALELAAVVLAGGSQEDYAVHLDALLRAPRPSLQVLAHLLSTLARGDALDDVRHLALMHGLRDVEAAQ